MALSRQLQQAAHQSADRNTAHARDQGSWPFATTITTVTPGAAQDGSATVAVTIYDSEVTVAGYPDTYTPAVGHRVRCTYDKGHQLFIDFRIIGAP